jgi:sugar transferase (PEP-CTERM system associated)
MGRLLRTAFPFSNLVLVGLDAVGLFFAILFGYLLLYPGGSEAVLASVPGALAIVAAMVLLTGSLGVYRENAGQKFWAKVMRTTLAFAVVLPGLHWTFFRLPDGSVCAPCLAGTLAIAFAARLALLAYGSRPDLRERRVMILGVGADAAAVNDMLERRKTPSLSVIGFYSPANHQRIDNAVPAQKILPSDASLCETAGRHRVSEIVVAMRERRGGSLPLNELLDCKLRGIKVTDLSGFYEQHRGRVRIDLLRESWFVFGNGFRQGRLRMAVKRLFDISASLGLLFFAWPLMVVIAFLIKLESPGPILYRQERVGLGGRSFSIYKFRSMRTDAEKDGRPQWAQKGDARVTKVGRFIRLTRIDELPQLFCVLAGTMSLVGPRPERPYFVAQLEKEIPFYGARHSVKPGVTGWAQVRHQYGASIADSSDKLEYDLFYVKNHSLVFDLKILFHSVKVVLFAEGSR